MNPGDIAPAVLLAGIAGGGNAIRLIRDHVTKTREKESRNMSHPPRPEPGAPLTIEQEHVIAGATEPSLSEVIDGAIGDLRVISARVNELEDYTDPRTYISGPDDTLPTAAKRTIKTAKTILDRLQTAAIPGALPGPSLTEAIEIIGFIRHQHERIIEQVNEEEQQNRKDEQRPIYYYRRRTNHESGTSAVYYIRESDNTIHKSAYLSWDAESHADDERRAKAHIQKMHPSRNVQSVHDRAELNRTLYLIAKGRA